MKRANPTLSFLLKALVSVGFLSFLLWQIDMSQLFRVLSSAHLSYLGIALIGYFLGQVMSSMRWALLARALGFKNPFKEFVGFYLIGMFFNLFAPSTVGGDVGRVFYLAGGGNKGQGKYWTGSTATALISVITDRAIGMAVLVWIGAAALVVFPTYGLPHLVRYPIFALALGLLLCWLLFPLLSRFLQRREHPVGKHVRLALETYWGKGQIMLQTIGLSLLIHLIQAWMQILFGQALDVDIPWSYSLILYPLVGIFSALPISLNGIGLREGGYLFLLRRIDISSEKAIAFGLLWFILVAINSLIGGVLFVLRKNLNPSVIVSEVKNQVR